MSVSRLSSASNPDYSGLIRPPRPSYDRSSDILYYFKIPPTSSVEESNKILALVINALEIPLADPEKAAKETSSPHYFHQVKYYFNKMVEESLEKPSQRRDDLREAFNKALTDYLENFGGFLTAHKIGTFQTKIDLFDSDAKRSPFSEKAGQIELTAEETECAFVSSRDQLSRTIQNSKARDIFDLFVIPQEFLKDRALVLYALKEALLHPKKIKDGSYQIGIQESFKHELSQTFPCMTEDGQEFLLKALDQAYAKKNALDVKRRLKKIPEIKLAFALTLILALSTLVSVYTDNTFYITYGLGGLSGLSLIYSFYRLFGK